MKRAGLIFTLIVFVLLISSCAKQSTSSGSSAPSPTEEKKTETKISTADIASKSQYGSDFGPECGYTKGDERKFCTCKGDSEIGKDQKIYCNGTCDTTSCKCFKGRDEVPCPTTS